MLVVVTHNESINETLSLVNEKKSEDWLHLASEKFIANICL